MPEILIYARKGERVPKSKKALVFDLPFKRRIFIDENEDDTNVIDAHKSWLEWLNKQPNSVKCELLLEEYVKDNDDEPIEDFSIFSHTEDTQYCHRVISPFNAKSFAFIKYNETEDDGEDDTITTYKSWSNWIKGLPITLKAKYKNKYDSLFTSDEIKPKITKPPAKVIKLQTKITKTDTQSQKSKDDIQSQKMDTDTPTPSQKVSKSDKMKDDTKKIDKSDRSSQCSTKEKLYPLLDGAAIKFDPELLKPFSPGKNLSAGQKACADAYREIFGKEPYSYRPYFLTSPETGRPLELDIFDPELGIAIEYNGIQHYVEGRYADKIKLQKQRRHDVFKRQMCKKMCIKFIVVSYKIDDDDIYKYLLEQLELK